MPPTNAIGTVPRMSSASIDEPSARFSSTNTPNSAAAIAIVNARDARAWFSTRPREIQKVSGGELQLLPSDAAEPRPRRCQDRAR